MSFGFSVGRPVYGIFAVAGASAAGACSGGAERADVSTGGTGAAVDVATAGGIASHGAGMGVVGGAVVVVVVVGGAVVVVVVGVAHGYVDVGESSAGAASGVATFGVGVGVADGCAIEPAVPDIITSAAVPATKRDLDAERCGRHGAREGLDVIVMASFF